MTNELSNEQKCIMLRNGIEIWVDIEKIKKIEADILSGTLKGFIYVENNLINMADMIGIFSPRFIEKRDEREEAKNKARKGGYFCERHEQWLPPGIKCGYC